MRITWLTSLVLLELPCSEYVVEKLLTLLNIILDSVEYTLLLFKPLLQLLLSIVVFVQFFYCVLLQLVKFAECVDFLRRLRALNNFCLFRLLRGSNLLAQLLLLLGDFLSRQWIIRVFIDQIRVVDLINEFALISDPLPLLFALLLNNCLACVDFHLAYQQFLLVLDHFTLSL